MLHDTIRVEELHRVIVYDSNLDGKVPSLQVEFFYGLLKVLHWRYKRK